MRKMYGSHCHKSVTNWIQIFIFIRVRNDAATAQALLRLDAQAASSAQERHVQPSLAPARETNMLHEVRVSCSVFVFLLPDEAPYMVPRRQQKKDKKGMKPCFIPFV
jgi:hypothetical protein